MSDESWRALLDRMRTSVARIEFVGATFATETRRAEGRHFMCFSHDGNPRRLLLHDLPELLNRLCGVELRDVTDEWEIRGPAGVKVYTDAEPPWATRGP